MSAVPVVAPGGAPVVPPGVAPPGPASRSRGPRLVPLPARAWADVAVLTALALLGILGFAATFPDGAHLVAGIGGLAVGTGAGLLAAALRLGILPTALVAALAYVVFGSAFAMPGRALAFALPTAETLSGLGYGAVFGWTDIVTLTTPVAAPDYIGVLPYLCGLVVGLASATIAGRWYATRRRGALASAAGLVAPTAVYVLSVLYGTAEPYLAAVRGIAFAVLALVWLSWRVPESATASRSSRDAALRRRIAGVAVIAAVAVAGGTVVGSLLAPPAESRFVLREEVQPPFDPLEYPSPLSGFRYYTNTATEDVLFTVSGAGGADEPLHLRIATMDAYTGKLWTVTDAGLDSAGSGTFRLVGDGAALPAGGLRAPEELARAELRELQIVVGAYRDVWMPSAGSPRRVTFADAASRASTALRYNAATGVLVDTTVLAEGDSYVVDAWIPRVDDAALAGAAVARVDLPVPQNVPDLVSSRAQEYTRGLETPLEQLRELETRLREDGYLSHGQLTGQPSRAGHGADRMIDLLGADHLVGDAEQYAAAFALMARALDYPARVVVGFEIPAGSSDRVEVRGEDVTAWVEVAFEGAGWIAFHPTPDDTDVPQDEQPRPRTVPQPQVRQPPLPEAAQDELVTAVEIDEDEPDRPFALPAWVGPVAAAVLVPAAILLGPVLVLGAVKRRRRTRRRGAGPPDRRAAGAWDELVDAYAELGFAAPRRTTRLELAEHLEGQLREEALPAGAAPALRPLAARVDATAFSGALVAPAEIDTLWREADAAVAAARRSVPRVRRQLSRYRLRPRRDLVRDLSGRLSAAARPPRPASRPAQNGRSPG